MPSVRLTARKACCRASRPTSAALRAPDAVLDYRVGPRSPTPLACIRLRSTRLPGVAERRRALHVRLTRTGAVPVPVRAGQLPRLHVPSPDAPRRLDGSGARGTSPARWRRPLAMPMPPGSSTRRPGSRASQADASCTAIAHSSGVRRHRRPFVAWPRASGLAVLVRAWRRDVASGADARPTPARPLAAAGDAGEPVGGVASTTAEWPTGSSTDAIPARTRYSARCPRVGVLPADGRSRARWPGSSIAASGAASGAHAGSRSPARVEQADLVRQCR